MPSRWELREAQEQGWRSGALARSQAPQLRSQGAHAHKRKESDARMASIIWNIPKNSWMKLLKSVVSAALLSVQAGSSEIIIDNLLESDSYPSFTTLRPGIMV